MFAIAFPAIDPVAIAIGPVSIRWYALAYVAGILLAWRYMIILARRQTPQSVTSQDIDDFVLWATLGVVLGGRLGYVLFYKPAHFIQNPLEIFAMWQGGMSFHGGLCGVILASVVFARIRKIPWLQLGDLIAASVPIGLFLGRVANFINGELFGRTTTVSWGMIFPGGGPKPRHPSQLYEATLEGLILFAVCAYLAFATRALRQPAPEMTACVNGISNS